MIALGRWLGRSKEKADARAIVEAVSRVARREALFGPGRMADTFDGRFEMVTLHAILAMRRLKAEPGAEPLAQAFSDILFRTFDEALREIGVGDLSVPKRMKKIAGQFFGRFSAYDAALTAGDAAALGAALARNIWNADAAAYADALAAYARAADRALAAAPLSALAADATWPQPPA